ncbi:MAG: HEPN domain-containing protein [Candidatus Methylomirabilales bacterium]
MRPEALAEGRRWLDQAREDLRWAEHLAREGGYHIACFLAQQVAEKALKGFLYSRSVDLVLTHSVDDLVRMAAEYDEPFRTAPQGWGSLDGYYLPTRYPNALPGSIPARVYTREMAAGAVSLARQVVEFTARRIEGRA